MRCTCTWNVICLHSWLGGQRRTCSHGRQTDGHTRTQRRQRPQYLRSLSDEANVTNVSLSKPGNSVSYKLHEWHNVVMIRCRTHDREGMQRSVRSTIKSIIHTLPPTSHHHIFVNPADKTQLNE